MANIIIALDMPDLNIAKSIIYQTYSKVWGYKIGPHLFYPNFTNDAFKKFVLAASRHLFLDMKFHDTPDTIKKAVSGIEFLFPNMFTVHALGGYEMMKAAVEQRNITFSNAEDYSLVVAVTILTSLDANSWEQLINIPMEYIFDNLLEVAVSAGVDAVVCSGHEVKKVKINYPNLITVVPGIRMPNDMIDDQKRTVTPKEAIDNGADFLVIGRSITNTKNPEKALDKLLDTL